MKIGIIDDGVGVFCTLGKLKNSLSAEYVVQILNSHFPLGSLNKAQLLQVARQAVERAVSVHKCDAVVFSSIALSMAATKTLAQTSAVPLFGCEAPILHASTYTASQVLVVGDKFVTQIAKRFPNVIPLPLEDFPRLAEIGADDRTVVDYIAANAEKFCGSFDCIALGCSSMNLYKHCFSRVFPNVQIFDSLEGVARKLRKTYKKNSREESAFAFFGENGEDLCEKYNFFVEEFQSSY